MSSHNHESHDLEQFIHFLEDHGFEGDIGRSYAERLIAATDNSIYQQMPQLVLYPKHGNDVTLIVKAAQHTHVPVSPRGGGTGTNAQSLTQGVMVDVTRYMDQILHFDPNTLTVRLQPGVILSRLNAFLEPFGAFFPPMVSTATRATIGGMIATDASGKGSRLYGKTSDYIVSLDVILSDGSSFTAKTFKSDEREALFQEQCRAAEACREIYHTICEHAEEIERVFPKMNRGLTGYNLQKVVLPNGDFNPTRLLAGSEGTLAFTKEIVVRVKKKPRHKKLLVIRYATFDAALQHVQELVSAAPLAIEILDDHLLETARSDAAWSHIKDAIGKETTVPVQGMNFVEFADDNAHTLTKQVEKAKALATAAGVIDVHLIDDEKTIARLWELRAKAVGLLGRPKGLKQGVPFVEDTAVPPENLPAYIRDFRSILDDEGLEYGMFGHADVGCLHVRPFLNMHDVSDQKKIRRITDNVAHLTYRYGGLLWGEHGRGVRGEFSPLFFGETLFSALCRIKEAFDPYDLFNRGKLVPVGKHHVQKIDEIPFRGVLDAQIDAEHQKEYKEALTCNGNGSCFNQEPHTVMCPSYKATKDRLQSPKGRAALLREWLRLSEKKSKKTKDYRSFEKSVKNNLDTCLACKACSTQCPIKVDIPSLRSRFYHDYYKNRLRPLKDYLIYLLEPSLKFGRVFPKTCNLILHNKLSEMILSLLGLVDLPSFKISSLPKTAYLTHEWLTQKSEKKLVILQDSFVGTFEGTLVDDAYDVFTTLGYDVRLSPIVDNGKACHVKGFRKKFSHIAAKITQEVLSITQHNIPVIALEPATGLMFSHEYKEELQGRHVRVYSPEEFLYNNLTRKASVQREEVHLISHCSTQSLTPESGRLWADVMALFGVSVAQKKIGCCGMAGLFGHERKNATLSKKIFAKNWKNTMDNTFLVEGFSCRCQSERIVNYRPLHPLQFFKKILAAECKE